MSTARVGRLGLGILLVVAGCGGGGGSTTTDGGVTIDARATADGSGGSDGSTASDSAVATGNVVNGTLSGQAVHVKDAISVQKIMGNAGLVGVAMIDITGSCPLAMQNVDKASTFRAGPTITAMLNGAGTPSFALRTYKIGTNDNDFEVVGGTTAYLTEFRAYTSTATCANPNVVASRAASGTVTLSAISATSISGSFDATFAGGDHLTGSFVAPSCNYDPTGNSGPTPSCQ